MKTYDLYAITSASLEQSKEIVEVALGIQMYLHESGFRGGLYYRSKDLGTEHFILQRNYSPLDDEWTETQHQGSPFLLYVNETRRSATLQDAFAGIEGVCLLRRETL